ncbi:LysR family transcriptional regulator [Hominifimenecus sp. rT4P-3]|uniref:LysR family transcriptional regulator n=1 Tax=Hominifimenecus sp. rT4P-3 TaxID=3242979 RepID=UPI003DA69A85
MELRQLEYIDALYRFKNFTKAAQHLHVTQPTVTTAVKNLEKELGVLIFDRSGGNLTLTPAGEEILHRSEVILENVEKIYDRASITDGYQRQELNLGMPPISCAKLYPMVLQDFAKEEPNVDLIIQDICNHEIIEQIQQGGIEAGFLIRQDTLPEDMEYLNLEKGVLQVLLSENHPLSQKTSVSLEELANEEILMYEKGTSYTEYRIREEFFKKGITVQFRHYFKNFSTIYDLVSQNYGISFLLETTSPVLSHMTGIVTLPFTEPMTYQMGMIWSKSRFLSQSCRKFLHFVCEQYHLN